MNWCRVSRKGSGVVFGQRFRSGCNHRTMEEVSSTEFNRPQDVRLIQVLLNRLVGRPVGPELGPQQADMARIDCYSGSNDAS